MDQKVYPTIFVKGEGDETFNEHTTTAPYADIINL